MVGMIAKNFASAGNGENGNITVASVFFLEFFDGSNHSFRLMLDIVIYALVARNLAATKHLFKLK